MLWMTLIAVLLGLYRMSSLSTIANHVSPRASSRAVHTCEIPGLDPALDRYVVGRKKGSRQELFRSLSCEGIVEAAAEGEQRTSKRA